MEESEDEQLMAPVVVRAYAGGALRSAVSVSAAAGGGDDSDGNEGGGHEHVVCVGDAIETDDQEGFLR
jgi:hypothetical protein